MTPALRAFLLAAPGWLAAAAGPEPLPLEAWVERQGGSLRRGADGEIVAVDLRRSWIGDLDLQRLAGLARLRSLLLGQTHISDRALAVVAALPALRELDLFFCEHITDAGAARLRSAAKLERLNVRGTKIGESGVKFLTELQNLRSLDLGISEIGDPSIELLEALPRLETLALGGNRLSEAGIAGLRALKRLRELDLSGAQVTDSGIWVAQITDLNLKEIGALASLESLNLAAPSEEYVNAVSSGVPRLRGAIRISDFGVGELARLASLRRLNLARSKVTAAGLGRLRSLARLEELSLADCSGIGAGAGAALAEFPALRLLDVSGTAFDDAELAALRGHPALRRLIAAGTGVSAEGVAGFLAARPGRDAIH